MLVVFEPAHESELLSGELHSVALFDQAVSLVGSKVSLGGEPRWTVLNVDTYESVADSIHVAHCAVNVQAAGDRSTWREVQRGKERETNLVVFWGEDQDLGVAWNFTGRSPQIGEILPEFDVATHTIRPQPWRVASVQEYKPYIEGGAKPYAPAVQNNIKSDCYTAVYLAQCEAYSFAEA